MTQPATNNFGGFNNKSNGNSPFGATGFMNGGNKTVGGGLNAFQNQNQNQFQVKYFHFFNFFVNFFRREITLVLDKMHK